MDGLGQIIGFILELSSFYIFVAISDKWTPATFPSQCDPLGDAATHLIRDTS